MEDVGLRVRRLPRFGECGDDLQARVDRDERVVDVVVNLALRDEPGGERIERGDLDVIRRAQCAALLGRARRRCRRASRSRRWRGCGRRWGTRCGTCSACSGWSAGGCGRGARCRRGGRRARCGSGRSRRRLWRIGRATAPTAGGEQRAQRTCCPRRRDAAQECAPTQPGRVGPTGLDRRAHCFPSHTRNAATDTMRCRPVCSSETEDPSCHPLRQVYTVNRISIRSNRQYWMVFLLQLHKNMKNWPLLIPRPPRVRSRRHDFSLPRSRGDGSVREGAGG